MIQLCQSVPKHCTCKTSWTQPEMPGHRCVSKPNPNYWIDPFDQGSGHRTSMIQLYQSVPKHCTCKTSWTQPEMPGHRCVSKPNPNYWIDPFDQGSGHRTSMIQLCQSVPKHCACKASWMASTQNARSLYWCTYWLRTWPLPINNLYPEFI